MSAVASITTGQRTRVLNFVFRDQAASHGFLVFGRLVSHGEDFGARPHIPLGIPMTVETPLHL
jgi:hypothetical protein